MNHKLFALIGKSACGKSSIALELPSKYPICHSVLTREPRANSYDYDYVVSHEEFKTLKNNDKLCQYYYLEPNWYGMLKTEMFPIKTNSKSKVCVLATWESVEQLQKYLGKDKVVTILIERDNEEILDVLNQRGESSGSRLDHVNDINTHKQLQNKVDYIVHNKNLSETIETVTYIIDNEISKS